VLLIAEYAHPVDELMSLSWYSQSPPLMAKISSWVIPTRKRSLDKANGDDRYLFDVDSAVS
jgi:hypothetical protein